MIFIKILISLFIPFCFVCGLFALVSAFCKFQEWWADKVREGNGKIVVANKTVKAIGDVIAIALSVLCGVIFVVSITLIVCLIYQLIPF